MKLQKLLEVIREELKQPLPEPRVPPTTEKRKKRKEKKMAKKTTDGAEEAPKKRKKKKAAAEEAAPKKKSKKKSKAESSDDGDMVTLKKLAGEADITPQVARAKLRAAGVKRPDGSRWGWEKGSKDLMKARDALGL